MDTILGILGTTTLYVDGEPDETWGKPRERALLATLAVHAGRVVPLETLLRWAWPDESRTPANLGPTFHTYANRIRRALERLPSPPVLRAGQGGYRLDIDRSRIDLHRFRHLMAQAREHVKRDPRRVVELVEESLALWRGVPLADLSSEPAQAWRTALLHNEWLAAHTTMVSALLDLDRHEEAITQLDELHADHPSDVTLANLRLTALYGRRRFAEGLAFYLATWRRLRDDGDEQSIEHLRRHHAALATEHTTPDTPRPLLVPRRLPRDRVDFVGRRDELTALDEATAGRAGAVVIIDGLGGVGKTTLAVHWAHRARDRFPDGCLFVDLRGYTEGSAAVSPAAVVDELLLELGQPPDPTLSRREREVLLRAMLDDRRVLVVLDNARNIAGVHDLVSLLSSCVVIVTSRRRLTMLRTTTGARRISVRPMPERDATELLVTQLGARNRLTDEHRTRLVRLCGGFPLFLNVLAEDLAGRPPAQLAELAANLDRRALVLDVGEHGSGMAAGAACFASSYRALDEPERRLFRLLALHPGPAISVAAANSCDGRTPDDTARSLGLLADANLIEQPGELHTYRYHDLLAEFAKHCVENDESPEARHAAQQRLLDFYVAAATQASRALYPGYLVPPNQQLENRYVTAFADGEQALRWLRHQRANATAAIRFAHDAGFHDHVWRLVDPIATFLDKSGCHPESKDLRELAVMSAHAIGEHEGEASALLCVGLSCSAMGEHAQAQQFLEAALRMVEGTPGLERGEAAALHHLGKLAMTRGDSVDALTLLQRGLAVAERIDDRQGVSWFHSTIGRVLRMIDQHEDATVHLHQARWLAQQAGERSAEANSLVELGSLFHAQGDLSAAAAHCEQALEISVSATDLSAEAQICLVLCEICTERKQFARAADYGRRGVDLLRGKNITRHAAALETLGEALYHSGEWEQAVSSWHRAADLYSYIGAPGQATRLHAKIDIEVTARTDRTVPLTRPAKRPTQPTRTTREVHSKE